MSRDWSDCVADMLERCGKIAEFSVGLDFQTFSRREKDYDALLLNILLLGEAASQISEDIRKNWPAIPWREIVATRNALIHGYFAINDKILWDIVINEIPDLQSGLKNILASSQAGRSGHSAD